MRSLIFIDPGIDVTGVAKFAWEKKPRTLQGALGCLVFTRSIETKPGVALGDRLSELGSRASLLDADEFFVEVPTRSGMYGRHRGLDAQMAESLGKLYMAIGAICGGIGTVQGHPPQTVPASGISKDVRHGYLEDAAKVLGIPLPEGPRGGKREDEYDALWGGCQELLR